MSFPFYVLSEGILRVHRRHDMQVLVTRERGLTGYFETMSKWYCMSDN